MGDTNPDEVNRVWAWPQKWEYHVEEMSIADRWAARAQRAEVARVNKRLNELGQDGWELVSYDPIPLYGAFSNKLKTYAYLTLWKRPATE